MTQPCPTLETDRLILRGLTFNDAPRIQELAGEYEIAEGSATIPHPYTDGAAEKWIASCLEAMTEGKILSLAVTLKTNGDLIGVIGLEFRDQHKRAELGYWIGKPYWGRGYATEASRAVIDYAFSIGLNRVFAEYFSTNPASGRVMQKLGMTYEGRLRQHMMKWGEPKDMDVYGILAGEWNSRKNKE